MSSKKWSPTRLVAEMLNAGHRNILTFQWTPELADGKADAAIAEMERRGVVRTTLSGVHPTAAFPSWLAELRRKEDHPELACSAEGRTVAGLAAKAVPAEAPAPKCARVRKPYFPHLSRDRRQAGREIAARIKELLESRATGSLRLAALKRALHADRHPEAWQNAIELLRLHRIASVDDGSITHTWSGNDTLPDPYEPEKKTKRRKRGIQTEWFVHNRPKMDAGQHSEFGDDWEDDDEIE